VAYYLGIDGGGTKTTCAIGDDNSVIATATAGPSNIVRMGESVARQSLHRAIVQACAAAGITPPQVARACVGAAGAGSPEVVERVRRIVAEVLSVQPVVTGDMQIALESAFPAAPGIIVIAGTGSIVYGRDARGHTARAGGWGFSVSDEGSAHWIGREAVGAIFRAHDLTGNDATGRLHDKRSIAEGDDGHAYPESALFYELQQIWNITTIHDLVRVVNSTPAPDFAELLAAILKCAGAGDERCRAVLTGAGGELAQLAAIIVHRLFPQSYGGEVDLGARVPLAMVGGVFRHSALVREVFYNEIQKLDSRASVLQQVVEPVEGALRLARLG
jgi:N-acetylglucosamine kinase-like BadF-type ATPase